MFDKVLIANRGEIAVRIARACHELGMIAVAVYSDADRLALHVRVADEAYRVGPAPARDSYLDIDAIIAAAIESGAQAVHPGYGFLAENADFAERVTAAGLVFIGPPASAIRAMGDKAAAKRLMVEAKVPVVPGYQGEAQDEERLRAEAERIGYTLLIKAAAGGGGRGMREVRDGSQFSEQLAGARREALSAFGDDTVLLERLVEGARHVEIQVFGDAHGRIVYLGERDCSVQRRHQKVFEESPSPAVDDQLRRRMGEAAVRAAASVGYTNAGTVEFLLVENGEFYFLEMNTRLQVEHPVTEFTTGLDLVQLQLAVAAGESLPFDQAGVSLSGHAIEARLYAEDPANSYLPSAGKLSRFTMPAGAGVRVDAGYSGGDTVSHYYDPLLAKIIVGGETRHDAVRNLITALNETAVEGVTTNLPLLRSVAASPSFAAGSATIDFLDNRPVELPIDTRAADMIVLGAAGFLLTEPLRPRAGSYDPWLTSGPWRATGASRVLPLLVDGSARDVRASAGDEAGSWLIVVDGVSHGVRFDRLGSGELLLREGARVASFFREVGPAGAVLRHRGEEHHIDLAQPIRPDAAASVQATGGGGLLRAPMPGTVAKLHVDVGDRVKQRQTLAVMEAMKMEHAIQASMDGRVKAVHCREGERVAAGAVLIELEPAS
jgi:3-methylcrotonyl-CoA carboxylase alpha subunit